MNEKLFLISFKYLIKRIFEKIKYMTITTNKISIGNSFITSLNTLFRMNINREIKNTDENKNGTKCNSSLFLNL